mgnify:CR=1 FL=1
MRLKFRIFTRIKANIMNYQIKVNKTSESRLSKEDFSQLGFGKVFSDHMFVADYESGKWGDFRIVPFDYLPMHPAMSSIHYGQSIFEGLKARKNNKNEIVIFRPEKNLERLNRSAARMAMPQISEELFFEALDELLKFRDIIVKQNNKWKTDFISIMIPTNNIEHAISILLDFRPKMVDQDIVLSRGECVISSLDIEYSDDSIKPNNILQSMKRKNSSLNNLIDNLKLEIIL